MSNIITTRELFNDCYLLFGPNVGLPVGFLKNLLASELKTAYRKKALETHPDRAKVIGVDENETEELFKRVTLAYERLNSFINGSKDFDIVDGKPTRRNTKTNHRKYTKTTHNKNKQGNRDKQWTVSDHFYKGFVPNRKLLIVQYLYYSGQISWRAFFDAIYWQRKQRPLIGQIAQGWGILTPEEIRKILKERNYKDRFAEYAWHNGYITRFQFMALIGKQKMLQRPIGEYFTQHGILSIEEVNKVLENLKIHNNEFSDLKVKL